MSKFLNSHGAPMLLCPVALRRPTTWWGGSQRPSTCRTFMIRPKSLCSCSMRSFMSNLETQGGDGVTWGYAAMVTWSNSTTQYDRDQDSRSPQKRWEMWTFAIAKSCFVTSDYRLSDWRVSTLFSICFICFSKSPRPQCKDTLHQVACEHQVWIPKLDHSLKIWRLVFSMLHRQTTICLCQSCLHGLESNWSCIYLRLLLALDRVDVHISA